MTELIWDGKYKDGKKTSPVRIALPFQTIETVNESVQHKDRTIDEFIQSKDKWYNRLIWGDKKYVLPSLLPEFAGKINLIYIDPPFNVGSNFSYNAIIPDNPDTDDDESTQFVKQPSMIEQKAYRDTWGNGLDSYLQWFFETIVILRELLSDTGSIFVHLDWHIGQYAKVVMDEVFGYDNLQNDVIVHYTAVGLKAKSKKYHQNTENILFYSKNKGEHVWNETTEPIKDPNKYRTASKHVWNSDTGKADRLRNENGEIEYFEVTEYKPDNFIEVPALRGDKKLGYPTQKHEEILDRLIKSTCNEGDLVLDCFCGSGTTASVAEKLNRRWITCDLGRFAIHTTRKRLLGIQNVKPFIVQNLGKYERQQWIETEFDNAESKIATQKHYRKFITELYHGDQLDGYDWIHGVKNGRMIHVGSVEAPITIEDIKAAILEYWKLSVSEGKGSKGIDFLGWDFAFDVNQTAKEYAKTNNVDVHFKKIPREVLEKKAVEQGDIRFYELAYLDIKAEKHKSKKITVKLNDFIVPSGDIPEEVQSKITHWSQWIDYWAVDWDYCDDTFHNQWQSYRTKQNPKIELMADTEYEESGSYTIVVKVIDILGNDTTKSITIEV
jgi:adenine-specific DNA-methyltransferase